MYLLDTDTVSHLLRRTPPAKLAAKVIATPPDQQFTSSISLGELYFGAYRAGRHADVLLRGITDRVVPNLRVLAFDVGAARHFGVIKAELERLGTPLDDSDLQIAGIALARGLIVVTRNVRHFDRVSGLRVQNWVD